MSVPNLKSEVEKCKADNPQAWKDAHTGNSHTHDFIKLLAAKCHAIDPKFGLLGQRGDPGDLAEDALLYKGEGPGNDPTNGNQPVTAIDVIVAAGSADARPGWSVLDGAGPAAWVKPSAAQPGPTPIPQPPANTVPFKPYDGDGKWVQVSEVMQGDYKRANGVGLDGGCGMWIARTIHDCYMGENAQTPPLTLTASIAKHRAEWCAALGIPVQ